MADLCLQDLTRLTRMPDQDGPGDRIAGQLYYDVHFTGGDASNLILTDVTINGVDTARQETIITDPGDYEVQVNDYVITVVKTIPEITTITFPLAPTESRSLIIKDGQGEATDFPITVDGNGQTIDGAATYEINVNWQSIEFIYNGTQWNMIGSFNQPNLGNVVGPVSSTDNAIARFDGTTGRVLENSGVTITDSNVIVSPVTTGTAPLTIASTTQVANLNVARAGVADTVTVADAAADTTTFLMLAGSATGNLPVLTDAGLSYDASTNNLTASGGFTGNLTGTATIASTVSVADTTDTTCWVGLFESQTGDQAVKSDGGLTYNASTGILTATGFNGPITGNASTATALQTPRTIGAVSFDGTANIVPQTIQTVDDTADTTCFPLFANSSGTQTGGQQPKTNSSLGFDATTGTLRASIFSGAGTDLTGTAASLSIGGNAATVSTSNEASDTTCFPAFFTASGTQTLEPKNNTSFTFNASTAALGAAAVSVTGSTAAVNGIYLPSANNLGFSTNSTNAAAIDSSQRLLVGGSTGVSVGTINAGLQVAKKDNGFAAICLQQFSADANGNALQLTKSRNGTIGQNTILQNSDLINVIAWYGANGTDYTPAAQIACFVDGTPGASDMPGRIGLYTTADGAAVSSESLRIDNAGVVYFPRIGTTASAGNAFFNSGSSPANSIARSTSSLRYKKDIEPLWDSESEKIYDLDPIWYRSTALMDNPDWGWDGFSAEQVAQVQPRWVHWGHHQIGEELVEIGDGHKEMRPIYSKELEPDGVQYERLVVSMIQEMKKLKQRIEELENA